MDTTYRLIRARSGGLTFEEFYQREFSHVYRAIWLSARNQDDALEVTQEAFGRAFARWRNLQKQDWATGWVITTAHNWLRRRNRTAKTQRISEMAVGGPTPEAIDLRQALHRLPPRQREALVLFYVADLPVSIVADLMHISDARAFETIRRRMLLV